MNKKRILFIVLLILAMTFSCIACGKKEPDLTGKWIIDSEESTSYFEFYSDGTGIIADGDADGNIQKFSCTWIAEDGRLKVTTDLGILGSVSDSCEYELTEDTLTLKLDNETEIYHKADAAESTETIDEAAEVVEEDNVEEQVTYYECSDEIKAASPESGMVQIDDMVFCYGDKLSEVLNKIENSENIYTGLHDYNKNELVPANDTCQIVFLKNDNWYFELIVENITDDTIALENCTITYIASCKASKGNVFFAGFNQDDSEAITYDNVKKIMEKYEIYQEDTLYDRNNNRNIRISYVISTDISKSGELYIYFIFENDTKELKALEISQYPSAMMYAP